MRLPPVAASPLPPPLLGRWNSRRGLGDTPEHKQARPVVPRCMRCQILAEREQGESRALDALADQEMQRRVAVWLKKKGLT